MWKVHAILFLLSLLSCLAFADKKYTFEVSMQYKSPDCVERPVTLINGQFPGPTIYVSPGEFIEVEVRFLIDVDVHIYFVQLCTFISNSFMHVVFMRFRSL